MLENDYVRSLAKEWQSRWKHRPFDNNNGLGLQGSFALFYFLKEMEPAPEVVFEIGTWRGFSTWVIRQALPHAHIICSDPILASRQFLNHKTFAPEFRLKDVQYTWQDFSNIDYVVPNGSSEKVVAFFDDHQNKLPRAKQAAEKGIRHIIYDDNVPFIYSHITFENMAIATEDKERIFSAFSRYEIFPPMFDFTSSRSGFWKGIFSEQARMEFPTFYEQNSVYSWVTKVELIRE